MGQKYNETVSFSHLVKAFLYSEKELLKSKSVDVIYAALSAFKWWSKSEFE